jgi:hypothetical protein
MSVTLEVEQAVPLIYTSKGNVPEMSLKYSKGWEITDEVIIFKEEWHDTTGELVKNNVHMYARNGISMTGEQHKG